MWFRFKAWLTRFMDGRYGVDELNRALLIAYVIVVLLNLFLRLMLLDVLLWALIVWMIFRIFSRNEAKRRAENDRYLLLKRRAAAFIKRQRNRFRDRNTHRYRKCPHCKAVLRLPKKIGTMTVECPRCHERFDVTIKM